MHGSARRQAASFLRQQALATDLSPMDAAWLLLSFRMAGDDMLCRRLAACVRGADEDWLRQAPLFDVCLRLLALFSYDRTMVDGSMTAHLARRLLAAEQTVGGPYCDDAGKTDIATNAMIAQLFAAFDTPLPNVTAFLRQEIESQPAYMAHDKIRWLLAWPHIILPYVAWPGRVTGGEKRGDLSSIAEAVRLLGDTGKKQAKSPTPNEADAIAAHVRRELMQLASPLRETSLAAWRSVVAADPSHEITTLPRLFAESLRVPGVIDEVVHETLGMANFYTWIAYTIYDDFIDDEAIEAQLPAANVAHRAALRHYQTLSVRHRDLMAMVWRTFDTMDTANAWELAHCRFIVANNMVTVGTIPRYGNCMMLAKRASGHILGADIVTLLQPAILAKQRRYVHTGLTHYLIAKQLNDDLHDWRQDMRKGHISPVVALLLRAARVRPGVYPLDELCDRLQAIFWQSGLEAACRLVIRHVALARRAFEVSTVTVLDGPFFEMLLSRVERTARQAVAIHVNEKEFLRRYGDGYL